MSEAWVIDASPLILFSRIGRLDLIERLATTILIPSAVIEEVRDGEHRDNTAKAALEWAARYQVPDIDAPSTIEHWDLGAGESQVIAHGVLRSSRWAVLDDLAARRCALAHGIPVIGSLGIVLRSKVRGVCDEARPLVAKLLDAGMYVDEELVNHALRSIGE